MSNFTSGLVAVLTAIIGVALVAVVLSRNSNTAGVIGVSGNAFSEMLGAATSPVSGMGFGMGAGGYGGLGFMNQGMGMGLGVP